MGSCVDLSSTLTMVNAVRFELSYLDKSEKSCRTIKNAKSGDVLFAFHSNIFRKLLKSFIGKSTSTVNV